MAHIPEEIARDLVRFFYAVQRTVRDALSPTSVPNVLAYCLRSLRDDEREEFAQMLSKMAAALQTLP